VSKITAQVLFNQVKLRARLQGFRVEVAAASCGLETKWEATKESAASATGRIVIGTESTREWPRRVKPVATVERFTSFHRDLLQICPKRQTEKSRRERERDREREEVLFSWPISWA